MLAYVQRKEGCRLFKKHSFERLMAHTVWKVITFQLVAMLVYVVMILVVMMIFADDEGYVYPWNEMFATLFTEIVVLILAYKPLWLLGEEHAGSLQMRTVRGSSYSGLIIGLWSVSPIILAWFINLTLGIFSASTTVFNSILGYLLYPWEPYFRVCRLYIDSSAWYMPFTYIPAIIPIPTLCHIAYRNGMNGVTLKRMLRRITREHK